MIGALGAFGAWLEQYGVIIMLLLILFGLRRLVNTDLGLVMRAVKDNDQAVKASGMNITHYKALAVFIASSVGCLARRVAGKKRYSSVIWPTP